MNSPHPLQSPAILRVELQDILCSLSVLVNAALGTRLVLGLLDPLIRHLGPNTDFALLAVILQDDDPLNAAVILLNLKPLDLAKACKASLGEPVEK